MPELTIAAVEVEAVRGPTGRFPYPVQWQAVPLDVYRAPGEPAGAPAEPDPAAAWPLTRILAPFLAGQDALAGATLWDLRGRAFDAPVWQLLGGSGRASVPAYVSTLGAPHDTATVRTLARELAGMGFAGQKWFPAHGPGSGAGGMRANITLAETVRDAVGPDVPVGARRIFAA